MLLLCAEKHHESTLTVPQENCRLCDLEAEVAELRQERDALNEAIDWANVGSDLAQAFREMQQQKESKP